MSLFIYSPVFLFTLFIVGGGWTILITQGFPLEDKVPGEVPVLNIESSEMNSSALQGAPAQLAAKVAAKLDMPKLTPAVTDQNHIKPIIAVDQQSSEYDLKKPVRVNSHLSSDIRGSGTITEHTRPDGSMTKITRFNGSLPFSAFQPHPFVISQWSPSPYFFSWTHPGTMNFEYKTRIPY